MYRIGALGISAGMKWELSAINSTWYFGTSAGSFDFIVNSALASRLDRKLWFGLYLRSITSLVYFRVSVFEKFSLPAWIGKGKSILMVSWLLLIILSLVCTIRCPIGERITSFLVTAIKLWMEFLYEDSSDVEVYYTVQSFLVFVTFGSHFWIGSRICAWCGLYYWNIREYSELGKNSQDQPSVSTRDLKRMCQLTRANEIGPVNGRERPVWI